jgi:3alpha(or 20beta)-hydroxysteroid dehydrogenase
MGRLSGKVALITGASGGQGAEEAKLFAEEGAKVVLADVNKEGLDALVEDINARGLEALAVVLDVSSEEQWSDAIRQVDERYGRLDVLVNNAGIMAFGGVVETEVQAWNRMVSINQTGPWLGMKYSVPLMRKSGDGGSIINLSSIYGIIGANGAVAYQGTKAAIRGISRSAAIEFAADRIRVNSVMPGFIDSPMTARVLEEQGLDHPDIVNTPLKRPGLPIEIAYGVLYLASDEASFVTGAEIVIDGGLTAW